MKQPVSKPSSEIVLYQTEDGRTRIECRFENENVWMTQALMAELFQVTVPTVNEHLKGIYAEGELPAGATVRKFRIVRFEGARQVTREIEHYNLEAILAVGYRGRNLTLPPSPSPRPSGERAGARGFELESASSPRPSPPLVEEREKKWRLCQVVPRYHLHS
jgi:hypothetical protein